MVDGDRKLTIEFHKRDVTEDVDRRGRILTGVAWGERGEELKSVYVGTFKKLGWSQHYWKRGTGRGDWRFWGERILRESKSKHTEEGLSDGLGVFIWESWSSVDQFTGQSGCGLFFSLIYLHDHSCLADREQAAAMLGNWPKEYEEGRGWSWGGGESGCKSRWAVGLEWVRGEGGLRTVMGSKGMIQSLSHRSPWDGELLGFGVITIEKITSDSAGKGYLPKVFKGIISKSSKGPWACVTEVGWIKISLQVNKSSTFASVRE